jgi:hypothetical protein
MTTVMTGASLALALIMGPAWSGDTETANYITRGCRAFLRGRFETHCQACSSSGNAFASFRS